MVIVRRALSKTYFNFAFFDPDCCKMSTNSSIFADAGPVVTGSIAFLVFYGVLLGGGLATVILKKSSTKSEKAQNIQ